MKRIIISLLLVLAAFNVEAQKNQAINVVTYNIRYATEKDGVHAWSQRKDNVKALVRFHDTDILCTQEALAEDLEEAGEEAMAVHSPRAHQKRSTSLPHTQEARSIMHHMLP